MISIDARSLQSPYPTGIERMTRGLIEHWPKDTETLHVLLSQDVDLPEGNINKKVIHLPGFAWYRAYLPVYLRRGGSHFFISPTTLFPPGLPAHVVRVAVVHDLAYHYYPETYTKDDLHALVNRTDPAICSADIIMAVSESTKNDCVQFLGIDPSRIHVAHLSADAPIAIQDQDVSVRIPQRPFLLTVGTAYGRKNLKIVPGVLRVLRETHGITIDVVMTGKLGFAEQDVLQRARAAGVEDQVHHVGFVSDEQKAWLFRHAQAFMFPSLYEGFGIPLLESMSYRCPIICSDIPVMREVAGNAALFANPESSEDFAATIAALLSDSEQRARLVAAGDSRVRDFSWQKMASVYAQAITQYENNRY